MTDATRKPFDLKSVSAQLEKRSGYLRNANVSHLFWVLDPSKGEVTFWQNLDDDEAAAIIELLVENHGGDIIDQVIDKIIEEGEPAEIIH